MRRLGNSLPMRDNTPFFIVGAGRSGTTLLRLILAGHSRLHIPPETWFILPLVAELPLTGVLTQAQVERAVTVMTENYRWPDMQIAAEDLRASALALAAPALVDIIDIVYQRHLAASGKARFGDKTPIYLDIVPQLSVLYPGARFIHLIRDGRDVAISNIDVRWERYYQPQRFGWTRAMAKRREYAGSPLADRIMELRYEDLVSRPEETVRHVCDFLSEAFEPAMLDWRRLTNLVPDREKHIHGKLDQPLSSDSISVWRQRLTAPECFAIEACLYQDLLQAGYQLRFRAAAWRPLLQGCGWLLTTMGPLLRRGVPYLQRRHLLPQRIYL
jgi:hypothetical protein